MMTTSAPRASWKPLALLVAGAFFMENLDGTIVVTATRRMAQSFHVPPVDLNVPVAAYLLVLGALIPVSGWLADRFGARRTFAWAVVVFTVASGLCALSMSLDFLTAMRVLQGAGGAMMVPVGRLVVLSAVDRANVINAVAYLTWPALAAPVIAPAIGGAITTFLSWRWIFVINLPLGAVAMIAALRLVPDVRATGQRRLDWVGFCLTALGILVFVGGLESVTGGSAALWRTLGALVVGGGLLFFAGRHLLRTAQPLLQLQVLRILTFRVMVLGGSLFRMANAAAPFLLPLLFQEAFGWSPLRAGLVIIPIFVANIGIKPFTTRLMRKFGFKTTLIVSNLASGLALMLCATFRAHTPLVLVVLVLLPVGMFRSIGFTAYNTLYLADIARDEMNNANTLASTIQQLTMGLGVAVGAIALYAATPIDKAFGVASSGRGPFLIAFLLIGILPLAAAGESATLGRGAGSTLTGPLAKRPEA
jgi:EmrB/QacA subfamily drug resistance transporter